MKLVAVMVAREERLRAVVAWLTQQLRARRGR
jgi:hypothetical protein